MSCPRLDLVCFSYLACARVLRIARYPDANGGAEVTEILHGIAGDGPMVAAHAAALGLAAGLIANAVGDEPEGRLALGYLDPHRIAHSIEVRPGADTPTLVVLSSPAGKRAWFAHLPGVRDILTQVDAVLLRRGRLAYVDCYPVIEEAAIRVVGLAHQAGVPVFCNLGGAPPSSRLAAALRGARLAVVQTNLDEANADQADALAEDLYTELGPDVAVVTCGVLGAAAGTAAGLCQASAPKVVVHQAHGAGAAFSAGFAYGYLRGWGPVDALRFACRLGSLRCAVPLHVEALTTADMAHRLSKEVNELEAITGPARPGGLLTTAHAERRHQMIEPFLADVRALDWNDLEAVEATNRKFLTVLAERPDVLHALLHQVTQLPELLALCEHYDILDKLVLYDDQQYGFRVRLHVFLPGYFDRPHNHRWTYSSRILHGRYRHYLYGPDDGVTDATDVDDLVPLMVREEVAGSTYTLHHRMVHAVVAEPSTVSLIVRGPAVKQRFLVMDRATKDAWWQYGAKDEPREEADRKRMTLDRVHATKAKLEELAIL